MGYVIKATLGLVLCIGGLILFNVKLVSLLETGTCASGNVNFQIAPGHECPSGTGSDIMLLIGSIFAGLIGLGLFQYRGNPPWDPNRQPDLDSDFSFPAFVWGAGFTSTGAVSLIAGLTNESVKNANGAQLGALIVGGVFLVMGLPVFLASLWWAYKAFRNRRSRGGASPTATAALAGSASTKPVVSATPWVSAGGFASKAGSGDQIAKLERLQRLHQSGALTDSEFEREKAKVLAGG
jgi:Short C-terminal domain